MLAIAVAASGLAPRSVAAADTLLDANADVGAMVPWALYGDELVINVSTLNPPAELGVQDSVGTWDTAKSYSQGKSPFTGTYSKVRFYSPTHPTKLKNLFYNCTIGAFDCGNLDTSAVTTMESCFQGATLPAELDLSSLDTHALTEMDYCFRKSTVVSLNVDGWDTLNVTEMSCVFWNCKQLVDIDLDSWTIPKVKSLEYLFCGCEALKTVDLSNFRETACTSLARMFQSCTSLRSLKLPFIDTSAVETMTNMFEGDSSLEEIDVTGFKTSSLTNTTRMFSVAAT